ncbi:GAF domain-containing protein [bacterium]|nr:GAF domain-containing protein [bacterium]
MEDLELLKQALEQADFGVVISALDSSLLYLNLSARRLLGVGADVPASSLNALSFRSQAAGQVVWETLVPEVVKGHRKTWTTVLRRLDGVEVPVEQTIFPLTSADGRPVLCGIIRDLQSQLNREAGLAHALQESEAASLAKSEFLTSMSHELRTPLNAILGFSQVLRQQTFGAVNAKQKRYLDNILSSGQHLLKLINEVLDLSRVESGHLDLDLEAVDLRCLAQQSLELLRPLAEEKGLKLEFESAPEPVQAYCDAMRLRQASLNLIGNAIKFTPKGGSIRVRSYLQDDCACLSVQDSGVGIETADLERIFGVFERARNGYSRTQEGTGLGLALTRKILRAQGGEVTVESESGQGSLFRLSLPIYRGQIGSPEPAPGANTYVNDAQRLRVLEQTGLLDSLPEEAYDRFVRLAADLLEAPTAALTLVDRDRQFFKSALGLGEPVASARETALCYSFCQHVVNQREPLSVQDAREDERVQHSPAVAELNVIAYLGVPLSVSGEVVGALCVIDSKPRQWDPRQLRVLNDLAAALNSELALRWQTLRARASEARLELLVKSAPLKFWTLSRRPGAQPRCLDDHAWGPSAEWLEAALIARQPHLELGETYQWDRLDRDRWILERGQPLNSDEFVGCWVDLSQLLHGQGRALHA